MQKSIGINEKKGPMTEGQKEKCKSMLIANRNLYRRLLSDRCAGQSEDDLEDYKEVIKELEEQIQDPEKYYGSYYACEAMFREDVEAFSFLHRCYHILYDELDHIIGDQTIHEYLYGKKE